MRLKPYSPSALLLALLALPALSSGPALAAEAAAPAAAPAPAWYRHSAAEIGLFLTSFYGDHGPTAFDRAYRVSQVLKDRQKANPEADVLLCAQNEPRGVTIGAVTVAQSAGVGWATVTTHWAGDDTDTFTAYVRLDSLPIALDDVICAG
ncbi:hypothetical protein ACFWUW_13765 [Streptomyces sp. NPDC058655]|uniref:hypothetical protein n=1 Tax=unclassified Streptomyces TaxID=2593676 RepID=UPI0036487F56